MRTEAEYAEIEKLAGKETVEALKESDAERDEKLKEIRSLKETLLQMNAADVGNAFKQVLADDLNISSYQTSDPYEVRLFLLQTWHTSSLRCVCAKNSLWC